MNGRLTVLALAALSCTSARAQEAEFPGPLALMVGHCWSATFPDGKSIDTHCFRLINNGRTVEDRHVVSGGTSAYGGIATYHHDPETRRIAFTYVASDGGISQGHLEPQAGGFLVPADRYVGRDGKATVMRTVATFEGTDSYRMQTAVIDGAITRPMFDQRFARVRPAPVPSAVVAGDLSISRAIVRAVEPIGGDVAAYVAIDNAGQSDRLLRIDCVCAEAVELHTLTGEGTARQMEKSWPLDLPASSTVEVKPGSPRHLMLMGSKQSIRLGEPVKMTLHFKRAGAVQVDFQPVTDSVVGW